MRAEIYKGPLDAYPLAAVRIAAPVTILEVLASPDLAVPAWFHEFGEVKLGGHVIHKELWGKVRLKPESQAVLELCVVQQKDTLIPVIAIVAVAAAVAIGTFGLPFLGIAAGSLWANVIAAGVGIAAQLAIRALTAAPVADNQPGAGGVQKIVAGITSNVPVMNDSLPVVLGKIGFSPPHLMPPYTTYSNGSTSVVAVMGFQGVCQFNKILINGVATDQIAGLSIETREGWASDAPRTIGTNMVIEIRPGQTLSNFDSQQSAATSDPLQHQPLNQNDIPQWHGLVTSGDCDSFTIRLLAPGGFTDNSAPTSKAKVPVRVGIRPKGTATWRYLPEIHLQDILHGSGPMRAEIRCTFAKPRGGMFIGRDDLYNLYDVSAESGVGQTFYWSADPYFIQNIVANSNSPDLSSGAADVATAPTTGGITYSASSELDAAHAAWKACDGTRATAWNAAVGDLVGSWFKIGLSSAQTWRSYMFATCNALSWNIEGSNDNVNWTNLDDGITDGSLTQWGSQYCHIKNPGSYLWYRWTFLSFPVTAARAIAGELKVYLVDGVCQNSGNSENGATNVAQQGVYSASASRARCKFSHIDSSGVTFWLDPAQWPTGAYEVQVMRGSVSPDGVFDPYALGYGAATNGFFNYVLTGGVYLAPYGQNYRSDLQIEVFQTLKNAAPFDPTGISLVAITAPDIQISSVYCEVTRYAPWFDGTVWTDALVPQKNPAALYRQVLLGGANAVPVPGEDIDEDELAAWYATCVAQGYECNAVLQGSRVLEALQMIASAGFGAPRISAQFGVVEDKDTSALPVSYAIAPLNSRDQGTRIETSANLPHAIWATFNDETDSYAQNQIAIYRDGYDASTAKLWETVTYTGHTNAAKVTKRATFDLRQLSLRLRKYVREVGIEGLLYKRGTLIALNDDVLSGNHAAGWIKKVNITGGNVVSIVLENVMPWSRTTSLDAVGDLASLTDILNPATQMAVAIRLPNQNLVVHAITETIDANTCTFVTPILDDGSIVADMMVVAGTLLDTHRRVKIFEVQPKGFEVFTVTMVDEAPALWS